MKAWIRDRVAAQELSEERLHALVAGVHERRERRRVRRRRVGLAAVALSVVLVVLVGRSGRAPGPLLTAAGEPWEKSLVGRTGSETLEFADGSRIEAEVGARVALLASSADAQVVVLERGLARFHVTPGGPRRWTVEAGLARVEVVGTRFTVDRGPRSVRVSVDHGVVLVRSLLLDAGERRLEAGDALELEAPPVASARSRAGPPPPRRRGPAGPSLRASRASAGRVEPAETPRTKPASATAPSPARRELP